MRKYRLIKELPFENSPKIGYISEPKPVGHENLHYWNCNWFNPKDYPEFWEEVVEKEYEILEYEYKPTGNRAILLNNGTYFATINPDACIIGASKETILKYDFNGDHKIIKIKRLSDREVFSIGDRVKENITGTCQGWEIKEFSLKDSRCFSCGVNINNLEKLKKALFTTEDGVPVYDKDIVYSVAINFNINKNIVGSTVFNDVKIFSTEKAARNYVKCNKPVLSYNEVLNMFIKICDYDDWGIATKEGPFKNKLTKLVESKL